LRRLCGWESAGQVPKNYDFSRAFARFSRWQLPQRVHELLIKEFLGAPRLVCHLSRDATAIEVRERPERKVKAEVVAPAKRKKGRPRKGELRAPREPSPVEAQLTRSLQENLAAIPVQCDIGVKRNGRGFRNFWCGYKLHWDVADGDIPVSVVISSASMHDSRGAIPLAQMSAQRVHALYELMDAAYDSVQISSFSKQLGRVPIIEPNARSWGYQRTLDPAEQLRMNARTSCERVSSNLKDNFGGRHVRVRGAAKVFTHLMFGVLALSALQLLKPFL